MPTVTKYRTNDSAEKRVCIYDLKTASDFTEECLCSADHAHRHESPAGLWGGRQAPD